MIPLLFALLAGQPALAAPAPAAACFATGKGCSDVDIEDPQAEKAFRKGCDAKDFYSCARLGQYFEVRKKDLLQAAKFYDLACKGKDSFGCGQTRDLHQRLCFLEEVKKFCDGREPTGEFRIYRYLKTFNPKYADAFRDHDFDREWNEDAVRNLYEKRVKEKNPKLLRTLQKELRSIYHDGASAEGIDYDIKCMKGKCPALDDVYR